MAEFEKHEVFRLKLKLLMDTMEFIEKEREENIDAETRSYIFIDQIERASLPFTENEVIRLLELTISEFKGQQVDRQIAKAVAAMPDSISVSEQIRFRGKTEQLKRGLDRG